jgi:hypothetical protein
LSVHWHSCPDGGMSVHREVSAAATIDRAWLPLRGGVVLAAS